MLIFFDNAQKQLEKFSLYFSSCNPFLFPSHPQPKMLVNSFSALNNIAILLIKMSHYFVKIRDKAPLIITVYFFFLNITIKSKRNGVEYM